MSKICTVCKEYRNIEEFHNDSAFSSGKHSQCKYCRTKRAGEWNKKNPERHRRNRYSATRDRLSKGLCKHCLSTRLPNHKNYCELHYINSLSNCHFKGKNIDYMDITIKLQAKLHNQNYICPYTGETLILGLNAHLEHILPVSRFPEYRYDLDNLEWVIKEVNQAKYNLTKDEFIIMCKRIISYMSDKI